jgi:hypothetical protein
MNNEELMKFLENLIWDDHFCDLSESIKKEAKRLENLLNKEVK